LDLITLLIITSSSIALSIMLVLGIMISNKLHGNATEILTAMNTESRSRNRELSARIRTLEHVTQELQAENAALKAEGAALRATIVRLQTDNELIRADRERQQKLLERMEIRLKEALDYIKLQNDVGSEPT